MSTATIFATNPDVLSSTGDVVLAADDTGILTGVKTAITGFLGDFQTEAISVIGAGVVIGLAIWGVPKLIGVLKKSAK